MKASKPIRFMPAVLAGLFLVLQSEGLANELKGLQVEPPKPISSTLLVDHNGETREFPAKNKRWKLVFFGYTRCPDVCPTTMFTVRQALNLLGKDAGNLDIAFISVDGQRDKPEELERFVSYYGKEVTGFTGNLRNIKSIEAQFGVTTRKFQGKTALAYTLQHSIFLYLLDPDNNLRVMYSGATLPSTLSEDMRQYLVGNG
jgi:protein SCO1/2